MKSLAGFLAGGKSTSIWLLLCCPEGGHIPEPRSGRAASTAEGVGHACCLSSQLSGCQGPSLRVPREKVVTGTLGKERKGVGEQPDTKDPAPSQSQGRTWRLA